MIRNPLVLLVCTLIAGCAGQRVCDPIRVPVPVESPPRLVVQPIEPVLLREHPEATGPLRDCPDIARRNLAELRACNHDKATLRSRHASPTDHGHADE